MSLPTLITVGILAIILVIFLIYKNIKDEQKFEEDVKNTYPIKKDENNDIIRDELEDVVH